MNQKLLQQKRLLKRALKKIEEIDTMELFLGGIDDAHVKEVCDRLKKEYAETMTELVDLMLADADLVAFKMPERKLKQTA